jgi:hypothetical protein
MQKHDSRFIKIPTINESPAASACISFHGPRKEAAYLLAMSVRSLDEYAKVGDIHPRFQGGKVVYHRSELERFSKCNHTSPFNREASTAAPVRSVPQSASTTPLRSAVA